MYSEICILIIAHIAKQSNSRNKLIYIKLRDKTTSYTEAVELDF